MKLDWSAWRPRHLALLGAFAAWVPVVDWAQTRGPVPGLAAVAVLIAIASRLPPTPLRRHRDRQE